MRKLTKEEFIQKSKLIHGDKYDYSLVEYICSKTKIKIIYEGCIYEQTPNHHLKGKCPEKRINKLKDSSTFISDSKKIHGDKYEYSLVHYMGCYEPVMIICLEHGEFKQRPDSHLNGKGCLKCGIEKVSNLSRTKISEFIEKSKNLHDKYDYSLVKDIISQNSKVSIICPTHGIFKQTPGKHLNNQGCPSCKESKGEKFIRLLLDKYNVEYTRQQTFKDCFFKNRLKFDFYLPDKNLCIEFDGVQHFKPVKQFGGEEDFEKTKIRDNIKNEYCIKNNIHLIRFSNINDIENNLRFLWE